MSWHDVTVAAPLIAALLVAVAVLVVDLIWPGRRALGRTVAPAGLAIVAALAIGAPPGTAFGGAYTQDALTSFLNILFVSIVALTILFAPDYLESRDLPIAEFAVVLIFAMTGAMLIAASTDLLLM